MGKLDSVLFVLLNLWPHGDDIIQHSVVHLFVLDVNVTFTHKVIS